MKRESRNKNAGKLVGPKDHSAWIKWRAARDKSIANPPRLKTCKDKENGR